MTLLVSYFDFFFTLSHPLQFKVNYDVANSGFKITHVILFNLMLFSDLEKMISKSYH
jgi:hypothetical protein